MTNDPRPRARDLGITIGVLPPGPLNAITDVAGVKVGHTTLIEGDSLRTGVTAILPHDGNLFQQKVPAAVAVGNGFGKLIGVTQIEELGMLETPIALTNTISVFAAADALVAYTLSLPGNERVESVNAVAGECNDGFLSDIRGRHIRADHVEGAIRSAQSGPVAEGCVGGGTGTRTLGYKGGIGTSSRVTPQKHGAYTVGVLAQTNFGGSLTINGAPVGRELGNYYLQDDLDPAQPEGGSCLLVVATNAPLDGRQLKRLARRALLGLAAVGSPMTHGSGDYVLAFSAAPQLFAAYTSPEKLESRTLLRDDGLSSLFQGCRDAAEEALLNSVLRATTMTGRAGHTVEAVDIDQVITICRRFGVIPAE